MPKAAMQDQPDAVDAAPAQTLADQLADRIGWDISIRKIEPGARIREVELSKRYGVSRPLIREVIQRLEVQGLVETIPWKGARVPVLTETQLSDLFDFIALVFGFTCRLAAARATEAQLARIAEAIDRLDRLAKSDCTQEEYERARADTHSIIEKSLGETSEMMQRRPLVRRMRHQFSIDSVATPELRRKSARRWKTLLKFLKARDSEGAEEHGRAMVLSSRGHGLAAHKRISAEQTDH